MFFKEALRSRRAIFAIAGQNFTNRIPRGTL